MKPRTMTKCQSQLGLALSPDPLIVPFVVLFVARHEESAIMNRAAGG
jgi:hypothetical protein